MPWLSIVAEGDLPLMRSEWTKVSEVGMSISFEVRLKKRWDGFDLVTGDVIRGETYVLAAASPQRISGKIYISGCITDISQQKWSQEQQKRQRDEAVDMKRQQEK